MKATGIVRRIDDLGRVVIPKEIRRTMRLREGDPVEIYTDKDGEIIFKKYSPISEISTYAVDFADALSKNISLGVVITDMDNVVAVTGASKKDLLERSISMDLEKLMLTRQMYVYKPGVIKKIPISQDGEKHNVSVMCPVIVDGDVVGSICLILPETGAIPSESDMKVVSTAALLLAKEFNS